MAPSVIHTGIISDLEEQAEWKEDRPQDDLQDQEHCADDRSDSEPRDHQTDECEKSEHVTG